MGRRPMVGAGGRRIIVRWTPVVDAEPVLDDTRRLEAAAVPDLATSSGFSPTATPGAPADEASEAVCRTQLEERAAAIGAES